MFALGLNLHIEEKVGEGGEFALPPSVPGDVETHTSVYHIWMHLKILIQIARTCERENN